MKIFVMKISVILILLTTSCSAFAWTLTFQFNVVNGAPVIDAATIATSVWPETGLDSFGSFAKMTRQGTTADTDTNTCSRSGSNDLTCIAIAMEETPTNGCIYCGSGEAQTNFFETRTWGPLCKKYLSGPGSN
jgi:hypothetical protein